MNKRLAKKVLTSQKNKLNASYVLGDFTWLSATRHYAEHIFSKESEAYVLLQAFRPVDEHDQLYPETKERLNKLLDQWTEMVDCGIYQPPPKPNLFRHFSDAHLVWIFPLVITTFVGGGILWGSYTTDYKVDSVTLENKTLKDSIGLLHLQIIKNNINFAADTVRLNQEIHASKEKESKTAQQPLRTKANR